jgi:hypothetical protein
LVVEVDAVFVVGFAHLADERFPVDCDAEVVDYCLDLLGEPLLETEEVDVADRSDAFAGSDEGIGCQTGFETDPADVLLFCLVGLLLECDGFGLLLLLLHLLLLLLLDFTCRYFQIEFIVDRFGEPDVVLIGDDYRRIEIKRYHLPNLQLLLA